MPLIRIHADGGCSGNPGPGAWACVIEADDAQTHLSGSEAMTTNNRMELMGIIAALETVDGWSEAAGWPIEVTTDSQYVHLGITQWMRRWEQTGWMTASRKPVKNKDLWLRLKSLGPERAVRWRWVRGHSGDEKNEQCHSMVRAAIEDFKRSRPS